MSYCIYWFLMSFFLIQTCFVHSLFSQEDFSIDPQTSEAIPHFAGEIAVLKGEAFKKVKGRDYTRTLKQGSKVLAGEMVQTGPKSFVKIQLVDDSVITLGPDTKMEIKEFAYKNKDERSVELDLVKGQIRGEIKRKVRDSHHFRIKTNHASMGVRGTEILTNVHMNQNFQTVSQFALLSGKVEVTNLLTKEKTQLNPKDHLMVAGRKDKIDMQAVMELSDEEFKALTSPENYKEGALPVLLNAQGPSHFGQKKSESRFLNSRDIKEEHIEGSSGIQEKLRKLNRTLKENR